MLNCNSWVLRKALQRTPQIAYTVTYITAQR